MSRRTEFKGSSAARRRERRAAKREAWKAANPLPPGINAKPATHMLTRKPGQGNYTPVSIKNIAAMAATQVAEYRNQIIRATCLYQYEFRRPALPEGSVCLPGTAVYQAGYRKSGDLTAS